MPQLLSLCSRAWEPKLLKPMYPRACAQQLEKSSVRSPCTATKDQSQLTATRESSSSNEDPAQLKIKITNYIKSFPGGLVGKESACSTGDLHLIPGWGRSPGGGHGNPLQYSCLDNLYGQRSLVGYSPRGCKELDTTE